MRAVTRAGLIATGLIAACSGQVDAPGAGERNDSAVSNPAVDDAADSPPDLLAPPPPDLVTPGLGPPYPIVLVHGMAGFRNIGPVEYFYGVPAALKKDGHDVWVSKQNPIEDSEARGPEVVSFVQSVLAATGKSRVNLIGHSQGGFDVRFVASAIGEHVGAVVTIASPMAGDPIADVALGGTPQAQQAIDQLLQLYGALMGYTGDAQKQIAMLSAPGAKQFFARHPDDPRVHYFSIAGRSEGAAKAGPCIVPDAPIFVSRWDFDVDPLDPVFAITAQMLDRLQPKPIHDGLVPVESAMHGKFLGCIPADHMDEVNQLFGDPPGLGNHFDAVQFYRDLASWLVAYGF